MGAHSWDKKNQTKQFPVYFKFISRDLFLPIAVLILSLVSIALLIWSHRITEKQRMSYDFNNTLLDIQIKTASAHLWFEEGITGDPAVDMEKLLGEMDYNIHQAETVLKGGVSENGLILPTLSYMELRKPMEKIVSLLTEFRDIAYQRHRQPDVAGIGSALDRYLDEIFKKFQQEAYTLDKLFEQRKLRDDMRSQRLYFIFLIAWVAIIVVSILGLWRREVGRKAAEKELAKTNEQLQSHSEELRRHREYLKELVEERTAELIAVNKNLGQEIEERKQAEKSLRSSENKFRTLVENLPQKIFLKDENSVYMYCNDNYARDLNLRPDEIVGKRDGEVLPEEPAKKERDEDKRILASGKIEEREERYRNNGQEVVVQKFKVPVRNERGGISGILGIVWDITEKVRLESIAQAANTMNNIGYVFSGLRHEIGNPINSVKLILSTLRNRLENCSRDTIKDYMERAATEISRVEYLLKVLKNFNMYESPELQNVDMKTFMERFLSLVANDFEKKGILVRSLDHPEAERGYADPRMLQQVMLNILSNASDAVQGRENPEITVRTLKTADLIRIRVTDNGCGMSEEQQKDLFKPFRTTKAEGTGLGLVIAKKMLTGMAGAIEINSRMGEGTIVEISIPEGRNEQIQTC